MPLVRTLTGEEGCRSEEWQDLNKYFNNTLLANDSRYTEILLFFIMHINFHWDGTVHLRVLPRNTEAPHLESFHSAHLCIHLLDK